MTGAFYSQNLAEGASITAMKRPFYFLAEPLVGRRLLQPQDLDPSKVKRVLLVRQHDQLGDFLLSTPLFPALKARFPGCHLGVLVRGYFAQLLEGHPDVDETLVWKPSGGWNMKKVREFWASLRSSWDLVIVPNTVSHSLTSDLLARLTRSPWVLGSSHRVFPGAKRNFLYDLEAPYRKGDRHQTDRNLDILAPLGVGSADRSPRMTLTSEEMDQAQKTLALLGLDLDRPAVGLHLGAGKKENRWPLGRFAELAEIIRSRGAQVVVTWGLGEGDLARRFQSLDPGPTVVAGAPAIRPLAAIFKALTAVVVNDTGMLHLAAAVGTPLVGVFGPTDPVEWLPIGEKFLAVRGPENSVSLAKARDVAKKLVGLLPVKSNAE